MHGMVWSLHPSTAHKHPNLFHKWFTFIWYIFLLYIMCGEFRWDTPCNPVAMHIESLQIFFVRIAFSSFLLSFLFVWICRFLEFKLHPILKDSLFLFSALCFELEPCSRFQSMWCMLFFKRYLFQRKHYSSSKFPWISHSYCDWQDFLLILKHFNWFLSKIRFKQIN